MSRVNHRPGSTCRLRTSHQAWAECQSERIAGSSIPPRLDGSCRSRARCQPCLGCLLKLVKEGQLTREGGGAARAVGHLVEPTRDRGISGCGVPAQLADRVFAHACGGSQGSGRDHRDGSSEAADLKGQHTTSARQGDGHSPGGGVPRDLRPMGWPPSNKGGRGASGARQRESPPGALEVAGRSTATSAAGSSRSRIATQPSWALECASHVLVVEGADGRHCR